MTSEKLLQVLLFMPGFLFSLSVHEAAHALVAYWKGDDTAKKLGRVSLSPVPHTDVLGTLVFPIFGMLFGGFLFGWGKPVPVDYRNLKNAKQDGLWISAAGPFSNLILAVFFAGLIHLIVYYYPALVENFTQYKTLLFAETIRNYLFLNLALCFFNLIPIQPLDGSKILFGILPGQLGLKVDQFTTRYGMAILLILIFTGSLRYVLWPPIDYVAGLLLGQ